MTTIRTLQLPSMAVNERPVDLRDGATGSSRGVQRVLIVLQSVSVGGMETHAIDLAAEYVRRGIRVHAVVPPLASLDSLEARFCAGGASVDRFSTDARFGRRTEVRLWWRLAETIRRLDPQVIHLHTPGATGGLAVAAIGRLAAPRATVVVTEHDVPNDFWTSRDRLTRLAMDRFADVIVSVSRRNARLRASRLPTNSLHSATVLNGVPILETNAEQHAFNRQRIRRELGIADDRAVVGSLVRLAEGKGLFDLLPAFANVVSGRACDLLLVGDGPLRADLEQLADTLGVREHVYFAGHQLEPSPFLDAMDIFVLAVPAGSMSIALLEAMAHGLPAVITFCGPEEAVIPEETGLCAPPADAAGLGRVLARLVDEPRLRERVGEAAARHVRQHFSVGRVADDLLELYQLPRHTGVPLRLAASSAPNPRPGSR